MKHDNQAQSAPVDSQETGDDVEPLSLDRDAASEGSGAENTSDANEQLSGPEVDMEYTAPIAPAGDPQDAAASGGEESIAADSEDTPPGDEDPAHDTDDIVENGENELPATENGDDTGDNEDEEPLLEETDEDDVDTITIVEALIFASDEPLTFKQIKDVIESSGAQVREDPESSEDNEPDEPESDDETSNDEDVSVQPPADKKSARPKLTIGKVRKWVEGINDTYTEEGRPFRIVEVAGGFAYQTIAAYAQYVGQLYTERSKRRLTQAALETLAIVAYKQPISKPGVEAIRGVNADYVMKSLLEKNLIAIVGREDTVGRPLLYGTTKQFLKHFGLHSLNDLPKPREIEELLKESEEELAPPIEINADQLPRAHHFDEPSIFDDVEREYGPMPLDEVETNNVQDLAAALNGNGLHEDSDQAIDSSPTDGSTDAAEAATDTGESDTPSLNAAGTDETDSTDEPMNDDYDDPLAASEEDAASDEHEQDSVENSGQDENLPDADTADENTEKE